MKNIGGSKLHIDEIDVYHNGLRILRNDSERLISINSAENIIDPLLWNKDEFVLIQIDKTLTNYTNNTFVVMDEFGKKSEQTCYFEE